jgi:hypothetical protein
MSWRYGKSELAMESPRLWTWERRLKLLLVATLAYAFLLSLLRSERLTLRHWLLRSWCHRTGNGKAEPRSLDSALPLTLGAQPALAGLSPFHEPGAPKSGMTHVRRRTASHLPSQCPSHERSYPG